MFVGYLIKQREKNETNFILKCELLDKTAIVNLNYLEKNDKTVS